MNKQTVYGVGLTILLAFSWLLIIWLAQSLGQTTHARVATAHPVVIRISTSTERFQVEMKPILARVKQHLIDRDRFNDETVVALPEFDKEMLWVKNNEIWRLSFPGTFWSVSQPELVVSSTAPIKSVALSPDGRYAAYVVRRFPLPPLPDYVYDGCLERLGDTVVVRDLQTREEWIVYQAKQATPGIGNLNFLPERDDLIFTNDKVYLYSFQKAVMSELTGFNDGQDGSSEFVGECASLSFFAHSPHGRYGIVYYFDHVPPAAEYIYDFQDNKLLGSFDYPDDFGGQSILGFVAEDQVLVFDDSYYDFQQLHYPQLAIFNLLGKPLMSLVTTSRDVWVMPEVFATSSLGWHIANPYYKDGEATMIFDPFSFKIITSTLRVPPPWEKIIWQHPEDATSTYLMRWRDDINFDPYIFDVSNVRSVSVR